MAKDYFYQAFFISAMVLADQYFEPELSGGGGQINLHLQEPQGHEWVIEIKPREAKENPRKKTRKAFNQIDTKNTISNSRTRETESGKTLCSSVGRGTSRSAWSWPKNGS
ncbi:MAG: PD-(D/E)XK nuclease domain-containing protein [Deltaproteobacteria bacterium]|nr:PD-(D/E)XK nuclease domain-containing protein [Deltaproteobacteria bacterium]